jgi:hypothetical protein
MPPISLHGAAKEGRLEDVRRLIVSNADLEARDDQVSARLRLVSGNSLCVHPLSF